MSSLKEALQFYVSSEPYDRNRNVSDIIFQIRQHVRDEFASRTAYFQLIIGILKKLVPTSILLLIYSAYVHLKNYLSRDAYDNIYINNQFRQMDQKRTKMAGESVLPLKGYEKNYVVDTSSGVLGTTGRGLVSRGVVRLLVASYVVVLVLHVRLCAILGPGTRPEAQPTGVWRHRKWQSRSGRDGRRNNCRTIGHISEGFPSRKVVQLHRRHSSLPSGPQTPFGGESGRLVSTLLVPLGVYSLQGVLPPGTEQHHGVFLPREGENPVDISVQHNR